VYVYTVGMVFALLVQFFPALMVRLDVVIPVLVIVSFFMGFQMASEPVL